MKWNMKIKLKKHILCHKNIVKNCNYLFLMAVREVWNKKKMEINILCHTNKNKESEKLKIWLKIVEYSSHFFLMAVREVWKKL